LHTQSPRANAGRVRGRLSGSLHGRHILVTGAGSGMGLAIARRFAAEGAKLGLIDVNAAGLRLAARGTTSLGYRADVSSESEVKKLVADAARKLGGIDGIINAAGIYERMAFADITLESWQRMLAVNLTGPYLLIRAALPHLKRNKSATVVNIASTGFLKPGAMMSHYVATKGGLIGLTRALAVDLAPKIRVNAICPGMIITGITRALYGKEKELRKLASTRTALQRIGEPEEIADAALWLTAGASFTTGSIVTVDGGSTYY
jgi:NAD(P)-dependent dehydrogenase (short-subunit alcohol dehydrogenase family)